MPSQDGAIKKVVAMKNISAEMPSQDGGIKTVVARISVAFESVF